MPSWKVLSLSGRFRVIGGNLVGFRKQTNSSAIMLSSGEKFALCLESIIAYAGQWAYADTTITGSGLRVRYTSNECSGVGVVEKVYYDYA